MWESKKVSYYYFLTFTNHGNTTQPYQSLVFTGFARRFVLTLSPCLKHEDLQVFAQAAAKNIKTETDLNDFRQMLTKCMRWADLRSLLVIAHVISTIFT